MSDIHDVITHTKCQKCVNMFKIFAVVVALILCYWLLLLNVHGNEENAVYGDHMNKIVFTLPYLEACCSWWPISHFVLFGMIGFLYPDCDVMAISAGVAWELVEVGVYYAMGADRQGVRRAGSERVQYSGNWFNGSFKDIFMNVMGFYLGKFLSRNVYNGVWCNKMVGNCECEKDKSK